MKKKASGVALKIYLFHFVSFVKELFGQKSNFKKPKLLESTVSMIKCMRFET